MNPGNVFEALLQKEKQKKANNTDRLQLYSFLATHFPSLVETPSVTTGTVLFVEDEDLFLLHEGEDTGFYALFDEKEILTLLSYYHQYNLPFSYQYTSNTVPSVKEIQQKIDNSLESGDKNAFLYYAKLYRSLRPMAEKERETE